MCNTIWENTEDKLISADAVFRNVAATNKRLDSGFFHVRYDRCTQMEKAFMAAMVKCGELPCTISNVAVIMNREVKSIGIFRSSLIRKGLIYSTSYGEIDFTVPQFDAFIKRTYPDF